MENILLIENYYKFLQKRTKYFKSQILNLDRYGFSELFSFESNKEGNIENILAFLKIQGIKSGHIVFRYFKDAWHEYHVAIYYNKNILDKYGNKKEYV